MDRPTLVDAVACALLAVLLTFFWGKAAQDRASEAATYSKSCWQTKGKKTKGRIVKELGRGKVLFAFPAGENDTVIEYFLENLEPCPIEKGNQK